MTHQNVGKVVAGVKKSERAADSLRMLDQRRVTLSTGQSGTQKTLQIAASMKPQTCPRDHVVQFGRIDGDALHDLRERLLPDRCCRGAQRFRGNSFFSLLLAMSLAVNHAIVNVP